MKNNTVLVVDDVPKNIQVVANSLKPFQVKILFAQSGAKALEVIKGESPDLILLDIMMPEMDGFQVCEQIKKMPHKKDIPIIFLTAKTDIESIARGFQLGGVDYITKPFNNEELLARVKTHLSLYNSLKTIQRQKHDLEGLNATKDKFFSLIAHDLRNPFNALLVLTEILKNRIRTMDLNEAVNMIELLHKSTKEGYTLLDNLLVWSKSQRNKLEFIPTDIDLYNTTEDNVHLLTALAGSKKITLKNEVIKGTRLYADANMIDTVLRNLITNAIKYSSDGGLVAISAEMEGNFITTTVKDNGVGIAPEVVETLFDIDVQNSTPGTANETGTGLGLVLCKEFIDKHNGEIWVESQINVGSEFKFKLAVKG